MATTQNITLGANYQLIVSDGSEFFLSLPWSTGATIELVTSDTAEPPDIEFGHQLTGSAIESINRSIIGDGNVFARSKHTGPLTIVLNIW